MPVHKAAEGTSASWTPSERLVGILGLGYVGLPLARAFVNAGYSVLGFDTDRAKIEKLERHEAYLNSIPTATIRAMAQTGRFAATGDLSRLREPNALLICVPTPLTSAREPDLSYVRATAEAIAQQLRPGQLVVLESSSYPGTTREVLLPPLLATRLAPGEEFFLAYSPEREDPGHADHTVDRLPKVIGALEPRSLERAIDLYRPVVPQVVPVSSLEAAEACKILENTYRAVNIALVNEMKVLLDRLGIDIWEVIAAASSKPFGFAPFYPGPGLGGHCIPVDPFYLTWAARRCGVATRFIELAGEVNAAMPDYAVRRLADALNERRMPISGSDILLLGMAYKKNVDDPRESPGFAILELLLQKGATVRYADPFLPLLPRMRRYPQLPELRSAELTPATLAAQDAVVIIADHDQFPWAMIAEHSTLVVDTRNALMSRSLVPKNLVRA